MCVIQLLRAPLKCLFSSSSFMSMISVRSWHDFKTLQPIPCCFSLELWVCRVCVPGQLETRVVDIVLCFLRQGWDLGGLRGGPLYRVEVVQCREEPQPVGGAHSLFQVTHLVQELLDGVVALHRAAFNHLQKRRCYQHPNSVLKNICLILRGLPWFLPLQSDWGHYPHVIVTVTASSSTSPH